MNCPHCNKKLDINAIPFRNAETYHNSVLSTTECCGKAIIIRPITIFEVVAYKGDRDTDDWGNKIIGSNL